MYRFAPRLAWIELFALILVLTIGCTGTPQETTKPAQALVFPPPPETSRFFFERTIMSSADVQVIDRRTRWRRMLTGDRGTAVGFAKPFDVTVCEGRVYVSDTVRRSVLAFDVPGRRFFEIGVEDPGLLRKPLGLATDHECNLYVVDGTAGLVAIYDREGQFITAIGGREWFSRASHVAVNADATKLFCVDTGGVDSEEHRIRVFDAKTGRHLYDIGSRGVEPGELNFARDIALGPDGLLYLVDGGNFRVQVFQQDGTFVRTFGSLGRSYGQFSRPKGIDVDREGRVYVSDTSFGNFQIFDKDGELLLFIGGRSQELAPGKYMLPAGLAVDEDGRVYMVDQFFRKLDVFRPAHLPEGSGYLGAVYAASK